MSVIQISQPETYAGSFIFELFQKAGVRFYLDIFDLTHSDVYSNMHQFFLDNQRQF